MASAVTLRAKLIFLSGVAIGWELVAQHWSALALNLPPPTVICGALFRELQSGELGRALGETVFHVAVALAIGLIAGFAAALSTFVHPACAVVLASLEVALRPIPRIALVPFAIVLFGISSVTAIAVVTLDVFWITVIITKAAIENVSPLLHELGKSYGYQSDRSRLLPLAVPAALPEIFTGLRTVVGQAWTLVVVAEIAGVPGLGQRLWEASGLLANEKVLAYILTIAILFQLSDQLVIQVRRRAFNWQIN